MPEFGSPSSETELSIHRKVDRRYPEKKRGKALEDVQRRFSAGVDNGYMLDHLSEWTDSARNGIATIIPQPRVFIPVELPASTESRVDLVTSLPYMPYTNRGDRPNVIVAAGVEEAEFNDPDNPMMMQSIFIIEG